MSVALDAGALSDSVKAHTGYWHRQHNMREQHLLSLRILLDLHRYISTGILLLT